MANNYTTEQIREFIACPQLGDDHYGKWGALTLEQRLVIADLLGKVEDLESANREMQEELDIVSLIIEYEDANEENN